MAERTNPHAEIVVGAQDKATPVFDSIKRGAQGMATGVEQSANRAGAAIGSIGDKAAPAAQKVDSATRSLANSMQRAEAALLAGSKGSADYFEQMIRIRGADANYLRPHLNALRLAEEANKSLVVSQREVGVAANMVRSQLLALGSAAAAAVSVKAFVSAADAVTRLQNQIRLATDGTLEAKTAFEALYGIAQRSRANFVELGSTFANISRATGELGISQAQLLKMTEAIGNAVAISGSSAQASQAALIQLSQGMASGVLRGEELNSVLEQTPRLAMAIADGLGVPIGKLREMGKEGELTAQKVINALLSQSDVLKGEVQTSVITLSQSMTTLGNSATMMAGEIDRVTGATSQMSAEVMAAAEAVDNIGRAFREADSAGKQTSIFGGAVATAFETVAVLGANVAYVIKGIGTELGGLAAQAAALATFNFNQAAAIRKEMVSDAEAARKEVDALTARILNARRLSEIAGKADGLDTRAEDARLAAYGKTAQGLNAVSDAGDKAAKSTKKASDEFASARQQAQEWQRYVESFNSAAISAQSGIDGLTKSQQKLVEFLQSPAYLNSSEPMRQTALEAAYAAIAIEQQAEAEKEAAKAAADLAKAREQLVQAQERSAANVEQQVQKLRDEEEALAISAAMNISLAEALEIVAMARLEDAKAKEIAKGKDADKAVIAAIEKEIAARKELASLMAKKEVRDANKKAAEEAAKAWERTSNEISQALTDALMRGFEDGKSFGENFADSLGNSIKTAVARALQQALAKNISAMFGGQGGFNWSSLFSGNNWASTIGSALGYGSTAGAGAGTLTYANAVGAMGGDSLGALAAANNQWAGVAASASEAAAASQSAASASSAAAGAWAGWAAVALATSSNMYKAGWNNDAMTEGAIATHRFGRFSSTTGQSQYTSTGQLAETANVITEKINMGILKAVGTSDKWAQILSGVPLTAGVWGRKLKGYGYDIDIAGGAVDVGGYEYHKGGLFRSNKTIEFDVDSRDAEELRRQVEAVRDSSAAMAKAMGYSDEAIESFTGNLKINFKGAETAAEQSERYNEALNDLNRQMINAATGADFTKEQFADFMGGIQDDIAAAGISSQGIGQILVDGMMGRLSQQEVGDQLADMIVGGIYESIAGNYANMIAEAFMGQIITPIFTAVMAGVPLSQAVSQQAIDNVVATATQAMEALNAILNSAEVQAAMAGIETAIKGVVGATSRVKIPSFGSARTSASNAAAQKAQQQAQERYNLETKLLQLLGKTDILRQRELASINAANRGLQLHIWAVEDAADSVNNAMAALERAVAAERDRLQEQLDSAMESEQALNDVFGVLRDNIRDLRGEVESTSQIDAAAGRDLIQQAIAGTKFDADELADAIDAVRHSIDKGNYATRFDQERAQLKLAAELSLLSDVTESELSAAEQQIALLEDQLNGLDVQLDLAQQQIDALFGVDTSVKGVAAAVAALGDAMGGYSAAIAAAASQSFSTGAAPSGGTSSGSYRVSSGGSSAKQWTAQGYWDKNPDLQREFIDKNLAASPDFNKDPNLSARDEYLQWHWRTYGQKENRKYARGGYYPGGLALVGEEGPELINFRQPGQVYTAMQTQNLLAGDGEVSRLLRQLIEETRSNAAAVVKRQVDLNKIVSRWDRDGMPEERDVTA